VARPRNFYRLLLGGLSRNNELAEYRSFLGRLYANILACSGKSLVVDSSVSPIHAFILSGIDSIDLSIVHIVRDPRAVAYSNQRDKKNPAAGEDGKMGKKHPFATSCTWNIYNTLSSLAGQKADSYCRMKYEDVAQNPYEEMIHLSEKLSIRYEPEVLFINKKKVRFKRNHMGSGNPMRFKNGEIEIRLDDEWRNSFNPLYKSMVSLCTFPGLLKFSYKV
jgi:hypothetical protein